MQFLVSVEFAVNCGCPPRLAFFMVMASVSVEVCFFLCLFCVLLP